MLRVRLVPAVFDDMERIVEHLRQHDVQDAEYRYLPAMDTALVLAIRVQRESGFAHP